MPAGSIVVPSNIRSRVGGSVQKSKRVASNSVVDTFTMGQEEYIVVSKAQLVALNLLRGKTGKKMPAEHKIEKAGHDVVDSHVDEHVCTIFFGADKLCNETDERIRDVCEASARECKEPCEPGKVKAILSKLNGDYDVKATKDGSTGHCLLLRVDPESRTRMKEESQDFVLRFIDTANASMSGTSRAVAYHLKTFAFGDGIRPGFSLDDSPSVAKERQTTLERGLRRAAERTEPAQFETHTELCFSLAESAKALSLGPAMRRISDADSAVSSLRAMANGDAPVFTVDDLDESSDIRNQRFLDEATTELELEDDSGLTFGSSFEDEKRGFRGSLSTGAKPSTIIARGGPALELGCSCHGCKAPDNKSCTDECVEEAPNSAEASSQMEVDAESYLSRIYKELCEECPGVIDEMRDEFMPKKPESGSGDAEPDAEPDESDELEHKSRNSHDVATAFDAAVAQARAYAKLKRDNATVPDGHHPVCLIKMIATMLRMGLECELTRRMVCCSNIECLERMGMRSPGWHTRFQCCQHARAILAERKLIPETQKTLYTLCNGSKRHGQSAGLLENVKALRHFTKHLKLGEGASYRLSDADVDALIAYLNVYAQWTQEQEKKSATVALKMANSVHVHNLPISNPQDMVDSVHDATFNYLARVVSPWIKDTQREYIDTAKGRDAHATTLQKMLDSAHPVAFDMTFIAMKLQQVDEIGVHGYKLDGTPAHPQKWWHNRKQGNTYNPTPDGSLTPGTTEMVPQLHPEQNFLFDGDVIMTFNEYVTDQLKYDSSLVQNYTELEKHEHDRKLQHGKLSLMLQHGHTRGGVFKDTMTSDDFVAGYLKTTKPCGGTSEACFEYIREGSADNRSDLQSVVRSICKGSLQSQKWIAQQLRRVQTDGMSGSRREVTHCRVPIPSTGLFVFDGINMLDKNVHPKRRMMHALQAFGAKSFAQFDAAVADINAKLKRQKDIAKGIEAHPLSNWSFVCNMHSGKPRKQTFRDSTNSFATDVAFDMAQQIRISLRENVNVCIADELEEPPEEGLEASCNQLLEANRRTWNVLAHVNSSVLRQCDVIRERFRTERAQKAKQVEAAAQALDSIEAEELVISVMEPFCELQVEQCKRQEFNALCDTKGPQCRADAVTSALKASRAVLAARSSATNSTVIHRVADAITEDLSKPAKLGGLRCLRGKDVCAVLSKREPLNPNEPNSPLVSVPFNAALALKTLSDYEAADEDAKGAMWEKREQALNDILYNTDVRFEDPNEYANAYDGVMRDAPAWEPCSVILMNVYDVAVKVTKEIIENNDSLRNSKPLRNVRNYERHAQGLINAMRIAPVYADSLLKFYPTGNLGIKTRDLTNHNQGGVNMKLLITKANELMEKSPELTFAQCQNELKDSCKGHRPLYGSRMLFDNSRLEPAGAVYAQTGTNPRDDSEPTITLSGRGMHSAYARATVLKTPVNHVYGGVGEFIFRVPGRTGPAAVVPSEDALKNEYEYIVPMSRAVKALEDLIADGYNHAWFAEIVERADKYTCWTPLAKPGEGSEITKLRERKLRELRNALEGVVDWLHQHEDNLPLDIQPESNDEAQLLELWENLSLVLEAYNPFCTPNMTREVFTWHPHTYIAIGDDLVPNEGGALGGLRKPLASPWTLPTIRDDVAWAMRLAPAARKIATFVDNVMHAVESQKRIKQRERQRDERQQEQLTDAAQAATAKRLVEVAELHQHAIDVAVAQLTELKLDTPYRMDMFSGMVGTLGAYRECMSRDVQRNRLFRYGGSGEDSRVMVGPYAGFTNRDVDEMKQLVPANGDIQSIFHPYAFGESKWERASTMELMKLDYARSRIALAIRRRERHMLAYDFEQAKLTGSPMESHVKAHKEFQERRRRRDEAARRMQDNFNLSRATATNNGGFSKDPKILKRHTNANTKRTENENNLQILKQSAVLNPDDDEIQREIADLESVIDGASMPKNFESFVGKEVPVRYIAAIREGRIAVATVTKVHERFEWPISDLVQNIGDLRAEVQRGLQRELDRVEAGAEGCITFRKEHQGVCIKASEDRKRRAETAYNDQVQKVRTFLDASSNELTAEAAANRRDLDPVGKRQKTHNEPSFEEFLDDRMGGSARVYSTDFQDRAHWLAISDNQSVASEYARSIAERQLGEWERARNESARRTYEILQQQVHAFHGADAEDDDGKERWRAYEQLLEVKSHENRK